MTDVPEVGARVRVFTEVTGDVVSADFLGRSFEIKDRQGKVLVASRHVTKVLVLPALPTTPGDAIWAQNALWVLMDGGLWCTGNGFTTATRTHFDFDKWIPLVVGGRLASTPLPPEGGISAL